MGIRSFCRRVLNSSRRGRSSTSNDRDHDRTEGVERRDRLEGVGVAHRDTHALRSLALIVAIAGYMPLSIYLSNISKFPHPERTLAFIGGFSVLGIAWLLLMRLLGNRPDASCLSAAVFLVVISTQGPSIGGMSPVLALALVSGGALLVAILGSRARAGFIRAANRVVVGFVLTGVVSVLLVNIGADARRLDELHESATPLPRALKHRPDIFLVLFDGYPGTTAMRKVYGIAPIQAKSPSLEIREAWASYPLTIASVGSVFEMGYPVDGEIDARVADALGRVVAGENRLFKFLDEQGYRIHYAESGYSRSYCSPVVDQCRQSAFLDEGAFRILDHSVFRRLARERFGSSYAINGLSVTRWLKTELPALAGNESADFVFAHVGIPHPPMVLDSNCRVDYDSRLAGPSVFLGEANIDRRQTAFLEQVECAALLEVEISGLVPPDAVLIFFSDHGGDSRGQLSQSQPWDPEDAVERLSSHLAVQGASDCYQADPVWLSEMMSELLWCLAEMEPPKEQMPPRAFAMRTGRASFHLVPLNADELARWGSG